MWAFLLKRVFHMIPILLGVSLLTYLLMSLAPGDFYSNLAANPQVSPEKLAELRAKRHLDKPWYVRYAFWLKGACQGGVDVRGVHGLVPHRRRAKLALRFDVRIREISRPRLPSHPAGARAGGERPGRHHAANALEPARFAARRIRHGGAGQGPGRGLG